MMFRSNYLCHEVKWLASILMWKMSSLSFDGSQMKWWRLSFFPIVNPPTTLQYPNVAFFSKPENCFSFQQQSWIWLLWSKQTTKYRPFRFATNKCIWFLNVSPSCYWLIFDLKRWLTWVRKIDVELSNKTHVDLTKYKLFPVQKFTCFKMNGFDSI